jgi:hypothetical protein
MPGSCRKELPGDNFCVFFALENSFFVGADNFNHVDSSQTDGGKHV